MAFLAEKCGITQWICDIFKINGLHTYIIILLIAAEMKYYPYFRSELVIKITSDIDKKELRCFEVKGILKFFYFSICLNDNELFKVKH